MARTYSAAVVVSDEVAVTIPEVRAITARTFRVWIAVEFGHPTSDDGVLPAIESTAGSELDLG